MKVYYILSWVVVIHFPWFEVNNVRALNRLIAQRGERVKEGWK